MKKIRYYAYTLALSVIMCSCLDDKKTILGQEFGDTSFANEKFSGNKINFKDLPNDLCSYLNTNIILNQYSDEGATSVKFDDKRRFMGKNCNFSIILNNTSSSFSIGFLSIIENQGEEETNWKETWEFQKKNKKSATYISGLGKAAIWTEKQRKLEIKMEGYTIALTVPALYDEKQLNKNYGYKKIALAIIKNTNLI